MNRIIFCLGSNIGDRKNYLDLATKALTKKLKLQNTKSSSILTNKALLLKDSPKEWDIDFYNIAFSGDINLDEFSPLKILETIKKIETDLGRKDRGKWSPREIDIDIAAINNLQFNFDETLKIPHQELLNRDFFLKTISEIEPEILKKLTNA